MSWLREMGRRMSSASSSGRTDGRKRPRPKQAAKNAESGNGADVNVTKLVDQVRVIIGNASEIEIRSCLFLERNNIERAINRWFRTYGPSASADHAPLSSSQSSNPECGPSSDLPPPPPPPPPPPLPSDPHCQQRKRQRKQKDDSQGDKRLDTSLVADRGSLNLGWGLCSMQLIMRGVECLEAGDSLDLWRDSIGSPFVRVGKEGVPLGRLEASIASFLGPLLDKRVIYVDATCQLLPEGKLKMFSSVQILVHVQIPNTNIFETRNNAELRDHLYTLVCWLFPKVQATVSAGSKHETSNDGCGTSAAIQKKQADVCSATSHQIDAEGLHIGLRTSLKHYQRTAVKWMVSREEQNESDAELSQHAALLERNPLWLKLSFPEQNASQPDEFMFVNPYSREIKCASETPALKPCRGGILADEMGLGKTVEMLALLAADKVLRRKKKSNGQSSSFRESNLVGQQRESRGTLIVVPMSVLGQWSDEIRKHIVPGVLSFVEYYDVVSSTANNGLRGGFKSVSTVAEHDVVLTTYGTLAAEYQRGGGALHSINWRRVVLDEAHTIKNKATITARACCAVKASRRWCMTGTPMQNSVEDLFSLITFLKHQPWSIKRWWNKIIGSTPLSRKHHKEDSKVEKNSMFDVQRLKIVLDPIMLRRTKQSIVSMESAPTKLVSEKELDSNAVLSPKALPASLKIPSFTQPKIENIQLEFSQAERQFYDGLFEHTKVEYRGYALAGTLSKNYATLLTLLLRLRQACDHPYLVLGRDEKPAAKEHVRAMPFGAITNFLQPTKDSINDNTLQIGEQSDEENTKKSDTTGLSEATKRLYRQWQESTCAKSSLSDPDLGADETSKESDQKLRPPPHVLDLLSSLAKGVSHLDQSKEDNNETDGTDDISLQPIECPVCFELPGISDTNGVSVVTPCGHGPICEKCFHEAGKFRGGVARQETDTSADVSCLMCPICREEVSPTGLFRLLQDEAKPGTYRALTKDEAKSFGNRFTDVSSLCCRKVIDSVEDNVADRLPQRPALSDLRSGQVALHSAKLDAMVEKLRLKLGIKISSPGSGPNQSSVSKPISSSSSLSSSSRPLSISAGVSSLPHNEPTHEKAVVFSQWTHMLDLVEYVLRRENISCVRLDGSLTQRQRQSRLKKFRTQPSIKVMIMSLKAGSLGLNLTCASFVILLDPWWNPAVEEQAINRVHRLGQTRAVHVCRFTISNTCEQKLVDLQRIKSSISNQILSETGSLSSQLQNKSQSANLTLGDLKRFWED